MIEDFCCNILLEPSVKRHYKYRVSLTYLLSPNMLCLYLCMQMCITKIDVSLLWCQVARGWITGFCMNKAVELYSCRMFVPSHFHTSFVLCDPGYTFYLSVLPISSVEINIGAHPSCYVVR